MKTVDTKVIAHIESAFNSKFGIPRQSGVVPELKARIIMEPEFRNPDAFRLLEGFSHIWLLWHFSKAVRETWSVRRFWEAIPELVFLLPAPHSGLTP